MVTAWSFPPCGEVMTVIPQRQRLCSDALGRPRVCLAWRWGPGDVCVLSVCVKEGGGKGPYLSIILQIELWVVVNTYYQPWLCWGL